MARGNALKILEQLVGVELGGDSSRGNLGDDSKEKGFVPEIQGYYIIKRERWGISGFNVSLPLIYATTPKQLREQAQIVFVLQSYRYYCAALESIIQQDSGSYDHSNYLFLKDFFVDSRNGASWHDSGPKHRKDIRLMTSAFRRLEAIASLLKSLPTTNSGFSHDEVMPEGISYRGYEGITDGIPILDTNPLVNLADLIDSIPTEAVKARDILYGRTRLRIIPSADANQACIGLIGEQEVGSLPDSKDVDGGELYAKHIRDWAQSLLRSEAEWVYKVFYDILRFRQLITLATNLGDLRDTASALQGNDRWLRLYNYPCSKPGVIFSIDQSHDPDQYVEREADDLDDEDSGDPLDIKAPISVKFDRSHRGYLITGSFYKTTSWLRDVKLAHDTAHYGVPMLAAEVLVDPSSRAWYHYVGRYREEEGLGLFKNQLQEMTGLLKRSRKKDLLLLDDPYSGTESKTELSHLDKTIEAMLGMGLCFAISSDNPGLRDLAKKYKGVQYKRIK